MGKSLRILRLISPYRYWMLLAVFLGFLTTASNLGLMMTSAWLIASAALHPSIADLQIAIVGVRFFGISRGVFRYCERLVSHNTTFKILTGVRVWFYRALEPLVPARLLHYRSPDLMLRLTGDVQGLEFLFVRTIIPFASVIATSVLIGIIFGRFSPLFAGILLIFYVVAGLILPWITYLAVRRVGGSIISLRNSLNSLIIDGVQGMADLTLSGSAESHFREISEVGRDYNALCRKRAGYLAACELGIGVMMTLAVLTVLVYAISMMENNLLSGVSLAVIVIGTMASFEVLLPLPEAITSLDTGIRGAARLFDVIDHPSPTAQMKEIKMPPVDPPEIVFESVSFRYPGCRKDALHEISLRLPPGSRTAVIGASGSGKTSLLRLLLGFWPANTGSIRLNHEQLTSFSSDELAEIFGVVSQNTYIFNGTIRENMLLAAPEARDETIRDALAAAEFDLGVAGTRGGLDTPVGRQGVKISGGERQRLAIARILLKNCPVLILDEPATGLDPQMEQRLMDTIVRISQDKTLILITHRLTGLNEMDRIIVLDDGKVIESGSHPELMEQESWYGQMLRIQCQSDR